MASRGRQTAQDARAAPLVGPDLPGRRKPMRQRIWSKVTIVGAVGALLLTAGCVAIEAGHEGVMVEQPFFFGHGGVDPVPSKTGRVWVAPTTKVVEVDVRPLQYSEHFDIISAENAPVSFDAFMIAHVLEGRSPEVISRFGA